MEPIPETVEALQELTRLGDESIARIVLRVSQAAEQIVPELVGLSVSVNGNLTFTLTATNLPTAELDGVQYLDGGPCEDALHTGERHTYRHGDPVDEDRWRLFARATAAAGVASTLSLPILDEGRVVAGINMYASTPEAFEGHHEELAEACGAWVDGAVTNADMGFTTRFRAAETPELLRIENLVNQAIGALIVAQGIPAEEAGQKIRASAQRAGISDAQIARAILALFTKAPSVELEEDFD